MKNFLKYITQLNLPIVILLLAGSVALWIPDFINSLSQPDIYYTWLYFPYSVCVSTAPWILIMVSFAACLINALMLTILLFTSGVTRERSMMPIIIYMFLSGVFSSIHFTPVGQFGLTLFCVVILILYSVYRQPMASEQVFLATLLLLLASVFVPEMLYFVIFIWVALAFERAMSLRTLSASLLAIATVVFYLWLYIYLSGDNTTLTILQQLVNRHIITMELSATLIVKIAIVLISIALVVYYYYTRPQLNVKHIVAYDLFLIIAFFTIVLIIIPSFDGLLYPIAIFTFSAFLAHYFLGTPSIVRGVMFILCFIAQLIFYFV